MFNSSIIGKLIFKGKLVNDEIYEKKKVEYAEIKNLIIANKYKSVDISDKIWCIYSLSNGFLIASNYYSISIYDKDFKVFKRINKIENISFYCNDLVVNESKNSIYFGDHQNHRIIMMDTDLNHIKSIKNPSYLPHGIDCYNDGIYVCNSMNSAIVKFSSDLELEQTFLIGYQPFQIKIIEKTSMVRPTQFIQNNSIYFHHTETFEFIRKYDGHKGTLNVVGLNFYEFYFTDKKLFCYDNNGVLLEELEIEINELTKSRFNGALVFYDKNLIIGSDQPSKLFVFET